MKKFSHVALAVLLVFFASILHAQKQSSLPKPSLRCASTERQLVYEKLNPGLKAATQLKKSAAARGAFAGNYRLQTTVTVPVVVHIVLPNPYIVTDADVQAQIDRLNLDFAGLNADSTNASIFYGVRGHSQIQFCLARRTPAGLLTNGIERRASNVGSDALANTDPIKRTAQGGLDAWTTSQYLNLWVGADASGYGILGYADNIGPGTAGNDGVFLNFQAFGSNPCYNLPVYNKGRTGSHEVGHYFGLYHIWGDDNGCAGDDFEQLPASTACTLPAGLFNPAGQGNTAADIGDTPNQASETTSCLSGTVPDACSPTGKMYQNHMDYTQDNCLSMFTKKQVARMEWVLQNCRTGLTTSPGCQPPTGAITLDIAPLASVNPGGFELAGCTPIFYSENLSCAGNIAPKFRVVNNGLTTITSLTVGYSINNGTPVTQTITVNIPSGGTYVATFPATAIAVGNHTIRYFTAAPNGSTDAVTTNDNLTKSFRVMAPTTAPLTEGFETNLPLSTWAIDNPNFDFTWMRTTPGKSPSAGKISIDNYNNEGYGNIDDIKSTSITVSPTTTYTLTFDLAHKNYPSSQYYDSLAVYISKDCGQTFTRVYYKGGPALATAGSSDDEYNAPAAADWRTETINLSGSILSTGNIVIVIRNISRYGNWLHLDNINLTPVGGRDLQLVAVQQPGSIVCASSLTPAVTVRNNAAETITGFKVGYSINNGPIATQTVSGLSLASNAVTTVPLTSVITPAPGNYVLKIYIFDPVSASGSGDGNTNNDTLVKTFAVPGVTTAPVVESFTGTSFPPANWSIINTDNAITWTRYANGNGNAGSAFIDVYNYNSPGQRDDLVSPQISYGAVDSLRLNFDLAATHDNNAVDTLEVLLSKDCGNSFTSVYKKWGTALQTINDPNFPQATAFYPLGNNQWRTENIDLSPFAQLSPVMIFFRVTNQSGNNIFLDNIGLTTRTLPAQLKQQGFIIYPVPFKDYFTLWHYQTPAGLRSIRVFNAAGQLVWQQQFTGNGDKQIPVNLTGKAAGVYTIQVGYADEGRNFSQRVVKY